MTSLTQQTIRAIATGFAGLAGAAIVVGLLLVAASGAQAMGGGYSWNQPGPTTAGAGVWSRAIPNGESWAKVRRSWSVGWPTVTGDRVSLYLVTCNSSASAAMKLAPNRKPNPIRIVWQRDMASHFYPDHP